MVKPSQKLAKKVPYRSQAPLKTEQSRAEPEQRVVVDASEGWQAWQLKMPSKKKILLTEHIFEHLIQ